MSAQPDRSPLPGSERQPLPNARAVGPADPNERIEVTILVRPRPSGAARVSPDELGARLPAERQHLTREEFEAAQGADPADLAKVQDFARANNLEVLEVSAARRTVRLGGTVAAFSAAFAVQLQRYEVDGQSYRGRVGPVQVPTYLLPIVQALLCLDDRPQASPHLRINVAMPRAQGASFSPVQVAQLYNFPKNSTGQGQSIGIIELGGGYRPAELQTYFTQLGITPPPVSAAGARRGRESARRAF